MSLNSAKALNYDLENLNYSLPVKVWMWTNPKFLNFNVVFIEWIWNVLRLFYEMISVFKTVKDSFFLNIAYPFERFYILLKAIHLIILILLLQNVFLVVTI